QALQTIIEEALSTKTLAQAFALLEGAGVAYGELRDVAALHQHPQLAAAGRWMTAPAETAHGLDDLPMLRPPWDTPASGWQTRPGAIPSLGQHSAEVRAELARGDWS